MDINLSTYAKCLYVDHRKRYIEKISKIHFIYPYDMKKTELDYVMDLGPKIVYPDIVNYLLFAPSPYTAEQLKCFKAMDSYNYFLSGFVKEVGANVFSNTCLLVGRVSHSQRLSEKPPTAWVISEIGGQVLSVHCNCMAGLGEACSHIGAILFYSRAATEKKDSVTLTGEKAYWVLPSNREVSYKEVSDIDFNSPNTSKTYAPGAEKKIKEVPSSSTPNEIELQDFSCKLNLSKSKPAILSLVPPYNVQYKPKSIQEIYPQVLSELYEPECISLNYREFLVKSKKLTFTASVSQQAAVESATRKQSDSRVWFRFRTGHNRLENA